MAEAVGGIAGSVQGMAGGALSKGQALLDRFFPPERRAQLWTWFQKFMTEKPMLASFLLSHIAISGIPLGLFVLMTITVGVFALVAALLVGLLGALLFTVFCVGLALIVLLPTLFFTTLVATFIFLWGVGTYYIVKWFNEKEVPGIHKPLSSIMDAGLPPKSENDELDALNPDPASAETNGGVGAGSGEKKPAKKAGGSHERTPAKGATGSSADVEGVDDSMLSRLSQASGVDLASVSDAKKKLGVGSTAELRKKASENGLEELRSGDWARKREVGGAGRAQPTSAVA